MSAKIAYDALIHPDRVHGSLYIDPAIFKDEMENIFHKGWVFVGHVSEVPNVGDFARRQIGRQPVLILHTPRDGVKLFLNRCTHRGNLLCTRARGNANSFTCPYHGWSFGIGGELRGMPMPGGMGEDFDKEGLSLAEVPRVGIHRGFIFASLAREGMSFDDYLGDAKILLDRAADLSPEGEVDLSAGWLKHRFKANWKMLPENNTDGYHVVTTHASLLRATGVADSLAFNDEKGDPSLIRDWGGGHTELDFAPRYRMMGMPFLWFGGTSPKKLPNYVAAMREAYGEDVANDRMMDGPPHAIIFPNLFLAELNITYFYPVSTNEVVQYYTPMLLKGAPEINARAIRQTEGAMGPGSFLLPEDACMAERNQLGLEAQYPEWLDLRRGMGREHVDAASGLLSSVVSDETTNRAFWRHYLSVMSEAA
ncbi:MAG TPA: ring-hydroxylating oxygenase subunit alpha [Alphaproteobacteria bacterium]|jgi:phenylpropionate dioxygenase-like ring-hydroxylating dioxygenase large terminal subunit|nr:ring-hydroxylating oxygenase subunit alpha [Alphaproteobacteria bacterium]HAM48577.1 ring-hydroxylating oxygenase subunit alpha [Alphaproteobacteria bacterium]HBF98694.1 ring-hydroxylating oxygenase subunit alpha [Alphaproteobacteria bacterium]